MKFLYRFNSFSESGQLETVYLESNIYGNEISKLIDLCAATFWNIDEIPCYYSANDLAVLMSKHFNLKIINKQIALRKLRLNKYKESIIYFRDLACFSNIHTFWIDYECLKCCYVPVQNTSPQKNFIDGHGEEYIYLKLYSCNSPENLLFTLINYKISNIPLFIKDCIALIYRNKVPADESHQNIRDSQYGKFKMLLKENFNEDLL